MKSTLGRHVFKHKYFVQCDFLLCFYSSVKNSFYLYFSEFLEDVNYPYNDINNGCDDIKESALECEKFCETVEGCIGFSWHGHDHSYCPKSCWAKSKMENEKQESGVTSGFASKI